MAKDRLVSMRLELEGRVAKLAHGLLDAQQFAAASRDAVRRALKFGNTRAVRILAKRYTLPQKEIRNRMSTWQRGAFHGFIRSRATRVPLHKFQPNPASPTAN